MERASSTIQAWLNSLLAIDYLPDNLSDLDVRQAELASQL
jgi:hypothetical protein